MSRVLKFTVADRDAAVIPLPINAQVLHVGEQGGAMQMWVLCDLSYPCRDRKFVTLFTGFDQVPEGATYIGTVISHGGNIVRHVFEVSND